MTEMVTSGSMSGKGKRGDGPLGERDHERRRVLSAPPALYAAAPLFDSTELGWIWKRLTRQDLVERATGIEPVSEAWEASVLPLY